MMETLLTYAAKQLLCGAVLFGYYYVFLRNQRFNQWNRFYLLTAAFLCMVVPFITIPVKAEQLPVTYELMSYNWTAGTLAANTTLLSADTIVLCVYLLGSVVMAGLLAGGLIAVYRMRRNKPVLELQNAKLVVVDDRRAPFSFFKWLYWRSDISIQTPAGERMLLHELAHIEQQHTADKLFIEICLLFSWFNPLMWLIKKEISAIHEFLADKQAVENGDSAAFASMILAAALPHNPLPLTSPLISSQLKRRLHMITNSSKSSYAYARRIAGLVLILLTAGILTVQVQKANAQPKTPHHSTPKAENLPDSIRAMQIWDNKGECYVTYKMKDGRRIVMKLNDVEAKGYPVPPPPPPPPPAPSSPASQMAPAAPASPKSPKSATNAPSPASPASPVAPTPAAAPRAPKAPKENSVDIATPAPLTDVVYFLNGELSDEASVKALSPNLIESVHVYKGEQAQQKLNGREVGSVVEVFTKGTGTISSPVVKISPVVAKKQLTWKPGERPMFIINDKEASEAEFRALPEDAVGEVQILKGSEATRRYGPKALNGVVIVRPGC